MSYKAEVIADHTGEWVGNDLSFATRAEADAYAEDLAGRWTAVRQWRVIYDALKPVTYCWTVDGRAQRIEAAASTKPTFNGYGTNANVLYKGYRKAIIAVTQAIETLEEIEFRKDDYDDEVHYHKALAQRKDHFHKLDEIRTDLAEIANAIFNGGHVK